MGSSAAVLMYFKHSLLTWALSQKSIYSAFFLTTEDALFLIHADDSARGMRLKDLTTVTTTLTTTLEATFPSTMESTHDHAMLLRASQPVSPPAIPPPPCRAESDLYETPLFHLTYHWLLYVWRRSWPWFLESSWCCFGVFFSFLGDEWLFVLFEYLWCVSIIYSKTMLQKFCKRHRCMCSKLIKIVRKEQAEVSQKFRSVIPCTYLWVLNWKKSREKNGHSEVSQKLRSVIPCTYLMYSHVR